MNTKKANSIALYVLATIITGGFFIMLGLLVFKSVPVENRDLLNIAIGALITAFSGGVVSYFFGSSAGSAQKTDLLHQNRPSDKPVE